MTHTFDFHFSFRSPYSYLAMLAVEAALSSATSLLSSSRGAGADEPVAPSPASASAT